LSDTERRLINVSNKGKATRGKGGHAWGAAMIYQSGNTDREEGEEAKHEKKRETQITQREMAVKRR